MGFPRQEYWSGLPSPPPEDLPDPAIEPVSSALAGGFFTTEPARKPTLCGLGPALKKRIFLSQFHFSVGNLFPSTSFQMDHLLVATSEYCQGLYLDWQGSGGPRVGAATTDHFPFKPCQLGLGKALTGEGG